MTINGREHIPKSGAVRARAGAPVVRRHADRRMRDVAPDAVHGQGHDVEEPPIGWLLSALGAFPVTRGTADREALARCIAVLEGGEPLVLFPEGERKSGPDRAPAVRRCRLRRDQGRRADRAGRHRRVGAGDAEEGQVRVPAQGAHRDRPADPATAGGARRTPAEGTSTRSTAERLHAELQRLFDEAMQHVPWDYPTDTELTRLSLDQTSARPVASWPMESKCRPGPGSRSIRRSMRATASRPASSPNRWVTRWRTSGRGMTPEPTGAHSGAAPNASSAARPASPRAGRAPARRRSRCGDPPAS